MTMEKRCCQNCVYAVKPQGRWLRVMLRRCPGLWICFNAVEGPGQLREVYAGGVCRNFRLRRWPRGRRDMPPEPLNDEIRYIPLTRGMYAIVDADDFEELSQHKWTLVRRGNSDYAGRREKGKHISMHREIMNTPDDMVVDHINGNGLNNRKSNMRNCTKAQNSYNSRPRGGHSGYVGVTYHKRSRKFSAVIGYNGEKIHVGEFDDEIEAAQARDRKALELQGEFAYLNFPEEFERAGRILAFGGAVVVRSRAVATLRRLRPDSHIPRAERSPV
jgi:HNH endonuclease